MNSLSKRSSVFVFAAILVAFAFSGCNTTKGLGKDVEKLGDKIQDKASR